MKKGTFKNVQQIEPEFGFQDEKNFWGGEKDFLSFEKNF